MSVRILITRDVRLKGGATIPAGSTHDARFRPTSASPRTGHVSEAAFNIAHPGFDDAGIRAHVPYGAAFVLDPEERVAIRSERSRSTYAVEAAAIAEAQRALDEAYRALRAEIAAQDPSLLEPVTDCPASGAAHAAGLLRRLSASA